MARTQKRQRVSDAVAKYTPRPVSEVFWMAFKSLREEDQGAFVNLLLDDPEWYEEIEDALSILQARHEQSRPFEQFEDELEREGLL